MKSHRITKIFSLSLVFFLMIPMAMASGFSKGKCSITIKHFNDNNPIVNDNFKLYNVGNVSEEGDFKLTEEFSKCGIDFENINEQGKWEEASSTLEAYVIENKIKQDKEEKTNENGTLKFSDLNKGLYLIIGDSKTVKTKAFLVALPNKDKVTGKWINDVVVNTKNEEVKEYIDFKVEKVWINDEENKKKPTSIEVDLYRDGKVFETVLLNEKNKWSYEWKNLESKYNWVAIEKNIPENYEVSYEKYATYIKIKNTYKSKETIAPPTTLPQTGSPWMLAQGFALTGIILISIGWVIKKRNG